MRYPSGVSVESIEQPCLVPCNNDLEQRRSVARVAGFLPAVSKLWNYRHDSHYRYALGLAKSRFEDNRSSTWNGA